MTLIERWRKRHYVRRAKRACRLAGHVPVAIVRRVAQVTARWYGWLEDTERHAQVAAQLAPLGVDDPYEVLPELVLMDYTRRTYHRVHPAIRKYWNREERHACNAVEGRGDTGAWYMDRVAGWDYLCRRLPSGRPLRYRAPAVTTHEDGSRELSYLLPHGGRERTWGGKIVENITQAVARDVLARVLVRAVRAGLEVCLHVHDEAAALIRRAREATLLGRLLNDPPPDMPDLPVHAEVETLYAYQK